MEETPYVPPAAKITFSDIRIDIENLRAVTLSAVAHILEFEESFDVFLEFDDDFDLLGISVGNLLNRAWQEYRTGGDDEL